MTYAVGGRQYVAVAAGGDGNVFGRGDELVVFALDAGGSARREHPARTSHGMALPNRRRLYPAVATSGARDVSAGGRIRRLPNAPHRGGVAPGWLTFRDAFHDARTRLMTPTPHVGQ